MNELQRKQRALTIAFFLIISGACLSAWSWSNISQRESSLVLFHGVLSNTPQSYHFMSGEECVGYWHGAINEEHAHLQYEGKGFLKVEAFRTPLTIAMRTKLGFNELRQMGASLLIITLQELPTFMIKAGTSGTVQLDTTFSINPQNKELSFTLPGPITLQGKEGSVEGYGLRYSHLPVGMKLPQLFDTSNEPVEIQKLSGIKECELSLTNSISLKGFTERYNKLSSFDLSSLEAMVSK